MVLSYSEYTLWFTRLRELTTVIAEFVLIKYTAAETAKLSLKFAVSLSMKLEAIPNNLNIFLSHKRKL
jgi:hypothetical protein